MKSLSKKIGRKRVNAINKRLAATPHPYELCQKIGINPSIHQQTIGVHKLYDWLTCKRLFYWKYIMNLEEKDLNFNLYYGSLVHSGLHSLNSGKSIGEAILAMEVENKKLLLNKIVRPDKLPEQRFLVQIAQNNVSVYNTLFHSKQKTNPSLGSERKIKFKIFKGMFFLCTLDNYYQKRNSLVIQDYKTSKNPNDWYFKALRFDKQIYMYTAMLQKLMGEPVKFFNYTVLKKAGIYVRKNETHLEFLKRYRDLLKDNKDEYFIHHKISIHQNTLNDVYNETRKEIGLLKVYLDTMQPEQRCCSENWPKNNKACFNYGLCPFFNLCDKINRWHVLYRAYNVRPLRYKAEHNELAFSVK
jgi:hypothetical protein